MRTITIPGYKRPAIFRDSLKHLVANDLTGWRICIQLEPTEMVDQYKAAAAESLPGIDYEITINPKRLGLRENTFALMEKVFAAGSELNIYLEEDVVIASDVTRLAAWYQDHYQPEWLCLSLLAGGCGGYGYQSFGEYPDLLFPSKSFNSLGFVVRKQEWDAHFSKAWMHDDESSCGPNGKNVGGFDWAIYHYLMATDGLNSLQSVAARAAHTGIEGGTHDDPAVFELTFADLTLTSGVANPADYRVVTVLTLPPPVKQFALLWEQLSLVLRAMSAKERPNRRLDRWVRGLGLALALISIGMFWLLARALPSVPAPTYVGLGLADLFILAGIAWWLRRGSKIRWVIGR
jgi:hypothetical protein